MIRFEKKTEPAATKPSDAKNDPKADDKAKTASRKKSGKASANQGVVDESADDQSNGSLL